jgi:hypothetical protein
LIIIGLLIFVEYTYFGGLSGFVVNEQQTVFDVNEGNNFNVVINDYERIGNQLKVKYSLTNKLEEYNEISLNYNLIDNEGYSAASDKLDVIIGAGSYMNYFLTINLPKDSVGDYTLDMTFSDKNEKIALSKEVYLSDSGLTGLAVSEGNQKILGGSFVFLVGIILLYYIVKLIFREEKYSVQANDVIRLEMQ